MHATMEQNREPRIKPPHMWSTDVQQGAKNTQWGKDNLQKMVLGKLDNHMKINEIKPLSYTTKITKINSKWIKDLNTTPDTTKLEKK